MLALVLAAAVGAAACAVPNRPAALVQAAPADSPPMAQQQGIFGLVQIAVTVDADGSVTATRVVRSPSAILNNAALRAARDSTYQPALQHCTPVAGDYLFAVTFPNPAVDVTLQVSARGETLAVVHATATAARTPDRVSVNALFITYGDSETAAFAANEATFAQIARETDGIATARTIAGPTTGRPVVSPVQPGTPPPVPDQPTPAPHVGVMREMGLRVERFEDVPRITKVLAAHGAGPIDAYWSLRDPSGAQNEALDAAIRLARTEADAFARSRGLRVVAVRRVEPERSAMPYAMSHPNFSGEDRPRDVFVERSVTVTYLLGR